MRVSVSSGLWIGNASSLANGHGSVRSSPCCGSTSCSEWSPCFSETAFFSCRRLPLMRRTARAFSIWKPGLTNGLTPSTILRHPACRHCSTRMAMRRTSGKASISIRRGIKWDSEYLPMNTLDMVTRPASPPNLPVNAPFMQRGNICITSGVKADSVVIVGRSVGGGPSTWLASAGKRCGTGIDRTVYLGVFRRFPGTDFSARPFSQSQADPGHADPAVGDPWRKRRGDSDFPRAQNSCTASLAEDKQFSRVPGAGHNDLFEIAGEDITRQVAEFARRVSR